MTQDTSAKALRAQAVKCERWADADGICTDAHHAFLEAAEYLRALAAEREGSQSEWVRSLPVMQLAETTLDDGHSWVRSVLDSEVIWCQWCGVHRVETPDWEDNPQCTAIVSARKAHSAAPPPPAAPDWRNDPATVERVARAIAKQVSLRGDHTSVYWQDWLNEADAALAAIPPAKEKG